ncbi:hypothetical protein C8J57DRAFT_1245693 [Mycena rebaudengoi]|nr:hypothetical protein C8J57DRAFT_1245693 [Mycena rebaudengoi]
MLTRAYSAWWCGPGHEHDVPARVAPGVERQVGRRGAGAGHGRGRQPPARAQAEVTALPSRCLRSSIGCARRLDGRTMAVGAFGEYGGRGYTTGARAFAVHGRRLVRPRFHWDVGVDTVRDISVYGYSNTSSE